MHSWPSRDEIQDFEADKNDPRRREGWDFLVGGNFLRCLGETSLINNGVFIMMNLIFLIGNIMNLRIFIVYYNL